MKYVYYATDRYVYYEATDATEKARKYYIKYINTVKEQIAHMGKQIIPREDFAFSGSRLDGKISEPIAIRYQQEHNEISRIISPENLHNISQNSKQEEDCTIYDIIILVNDILPSEKKIICQPLTMLATIKVQGFMTPN